MSCEVIHYTNPRVIVGCVNVWDNKVLLCKRGIEPRAGYWTLTAGFYENGESLRDGAAREAKEEACIDTNITDLLLVYDVPSINQVHIYFRAELPSPDYATTPESVEIQLFSESEIPWDDLAFPSVKYALEFYFADRKKGVSEPHVFSFPE